MPGMSNVAFPLSTTKLSSASSGISCGPNSLGSSRSSLTTVTLNRACKSRAQKRGWGQLGDRRSIFSMLTYRTSFCFWL